jgi:hypothetical protein
MTDNSVLLFWKGKRYKAKLFSFSETILELILLRYFRWLRIKIYLNKIFLKKTSPGHWLCPPPKSLDIFTNHKSVFRLYSLKEKKFSILGQNLHCKKNIVLWHVDPLSKKQWPRKYFKRLLPVTNIQDSSDCKIPWELSRFQHFPSLAKGHIATKDMRFVEEALWQIDDWIKENPCPYGINWTCAMEVSIRACNWMWAWWAFKDTEAWTEEFNGRFLKAMWQHGWYIEKNLENKGGIETNHYLSDIVGLLFIGVIFPQFKDAEKWRNFGVKEITRCMDEMVYEDGVSFENSTSYHRLVLEVFTYSAILCKNNNIELPTRFWCRLERMFEFIMHAMRPDGLMPMIGDNDDGRFFILSDYYTWERFDFCYLLSIGAVLFKRPEFKLAAGGRIYEETYWLVGKEEIEQHEQL